MEHMHEQEHHQWVAMEEEEVEEAVLEGRQCRKQLQDNVISSVIVSSSSWFPTSNGDGDDTSGVSSVDPYLDYGPIVQKEEEVAETGNVSESGVTYYNGDKVDKAAAGLGLGLAAEFVGAATNDNGEAISSVYFDKQEGSDANNGPSEAQNGDGARSVLLTNNGIGDFNMQVQNPVIQKSLCNEVNNQYMKTVEDKGPLSSELLSPMNDSYEIKAADVKHFDDETSTKASPELIKDIDQQPRDLDVEEVLAKQETHDLFCPNCNSCITKRVILRKRKRSIRNMDTADGSDLVDRSATKALRGDHANLTSNAGSLEQQPAADDSPVQEQEAFRCLECFSIFIPRGNGFIKFWNFGGAREHGTSQITSTIPASNIQNPSSITVSNVENSSNVTVSNVQNPSNIPTSNENWFFSLFSSKGKTPGEQGKASPKHSKTGPAEQSHSSLIASNVFTSPDNGHSDSPVTNTTNFENRRTEADIKAGHGGPNGNVRSTVGEENNDLADIKKTNIVGNLPSKKFSSVATASTSEELVNAEEPAKDAILKPYEREPDFLVPSNVGSEILAKSQKDVDKTPEIVQNGYPSLIMQAQVPAQSHSSAVLANDATINTQSPGVDAKISSGKDLKLINKGEKEIEEEIKPAVASQNKGTDVILFVEEDRVKSTTSQRADSVPVKSATFTEPATQVYTSEQARTEIGEPRGWEIIKSIVYGGLMELITSLGIVSSAASSGAAPLNIIALGLANLIGGLFIIGHNLLELKNGKSGEDLLQQMNMQEDRYQELLGRRANFVLHAIVAVLSFLIFGSVPIVIYGIFTNKKYQLEVMLAAVAATSLVCIILLVIGKVYTQRPPKSYTRTVFYYVTMALAASGVCYIAGGLVKDLLEKFSNSESGFVLTMPFSGTGTMDPAWRSY